MYISAILHYISYQGLLFLRLDQIPHIRRDNLSFFSDLPSIGLFYHPWCRWGVKDHGGEFLQTGVFFALS